MAEKCVGVAVQVLCLRPARPQTRSYLALLSSLSTVTTTSLSAPNILFSKGVRRNRRQWLPSLSALFALAVSAAMIAVVTGTVALSSWLGTSQLDLILSGKATAF